MIAGNRNDAPRGRPVMTVPEGRFVMTQGQVEGWLIMAHPGDILLYARSESLRCAAVADHVRTLADRGLVTFELQRRAIDDPSLFEYRVRRTALDRKTAKMPRAPGHHVRTVERVPA